MAETRLRRVERVMGTVLSLDVRDPSADPRVLDRAIQVLREADERFSPYRSDSEVSRLARGDGSEAIASTQLRSVLALADDLCRASGGYFDVRGHRPDGRLDPSGLVKGWAGEAAASVLDAAGIVDYCLNLGGDVITHGAPAPGRAWRVGIRHPHDASRLVALLVVGDLAVATSGAYERGAHITDPHTGRPPVDWLSLTVVGPSLTYADAYATTAFAMGRGGVAWVAGHPGYGVYAVDGRDTATWTDVIDGLLAPATPAEQPRP